MRFIVCIGFKYLSYALKKMKVIIKTCRFCGEKVLRYATQFDNFSYHVFSKHENEPEVKRVVQLEEEIRVLRDSFIKSIQEIKGKSIETILKHKELLK